MASGLKFRIQEVEGLCYQCSENKGADQLRGNREADLRLCFRICQKPVFLRRGSYNNKCFDGWKMLDCMDRASPNIVTTVWSKRVAKSEKVGLRRYIPFARF